MNFLMCFIHILHPFEAETRKHNKLVQNKADKMLLRILTQIFIIIIRRQKEYFFSVFSFKAISEVSVQ